MHWVDRGPEPAGLECIRSNHTPSWVQYYRHGVGSLPRDALWRNFHADLEKAFGGLCAYCEERSRGEIDHFRPKSLFPESVYSWSNWLFACHDCNNAKGWKWPVGGYVDPCAKSSPAHPEHYFIFDTQTGEILPRGDLSPRRRHKAQRMIDDLKLNERHHLKKRIEWLQLISAIIPEGPNSLTSDVEKDSAHFASRTIAHSSITRAWLSEQGYPIDE